MVRSNEQIGRQPAALLSRLDALADPTRLRLLWMLERQELGVVDLCEVLQMPQSTVSRHLKILSDQGWTCNRRQGTANLYSMLADELEPEARELWLLARQQTSAWATLQQDELRLTQRLEQRQATGHEFFADAAGHWHKLRGELYGDHFTQIALLDLLQRNLVVADLGCGTGSAVVELAERVNRVIGVDNSPAMLQAARERTSRFENVEIRQGDLEAIPIKDRQCDAAVMILVLSYVRDPDLALREMARIIKPGGRTVVIDLMRHDRDDFRRQMGQQRMGFEPTDLSQSLRDSGLRDVTCRALPPEKDATGPALLLATAHGGTSN